MSSDDPGTGWTPVRTAGVRGRIRALDRSVALLAAMAFVSQVGISVMLPLLPIYATSLGAGPAVLGALTGAFAITVSVGQLAGGFLADRYPARRLVTGGIALYAVTNLLIATASTAVSLVAYRALSGLGGGVNLLAERIYLTRAIPRERLASANGILSAAGSAGSVLGPAIGGILVALADLRAPFILVGITSLAAAIGSLFLPRTADEDQPTAPAGAPPDPDGSVGALVDRPPAGPEADLRSPVGGPASDDRPADPDRTRTAASAAPGRLRILLTLFVVQAGFQAAFGAFITTYGPFATERLGWATAEVGVVFALFGLGSVILGPFLARLADRVGRRDIALVGTLLVLVFPIVYVAEAPRVLLYPITIIAGGGVTALEASWFALLGEATDGGRRGRDYGTVTALSSLGIVVGAAIAAGLWEATGNVGLGLLVAAAVLAVSGAALLLLPRDRPAPMTDPAPPAPGP